MAPKEYANLSWRDAADQCLKAHDEAGKKKDDYYEPARSRFILACASAMAH